MLRERFLHAVRYTGRKKISALNSVRFAPPLAATFLRVTEKVAGIHMHIVSLIPRPAHFNTVSFLRVTEKVAGLGSGTRLT